MWQLCPGKDWAERWCSCLGHRDSGSTKCSGTQTASVVEAMALSESFSSCWLLEIRSPFVWSFSVAPPVQALKCLPWLGSFSIAWCIRRLEGKPLYYSAAGAGMWGERGYSEGSTPYAWLRSIILPPWLPDFPPQSFPTTISSLTFRWAVSQGKVNSRPCPGLIHQPYTPSPSCCAF